MTTKSRRRFGVALSFVLVLTLQACSGSQPNTGSTTSSTSTPVVPPNYQGYVDVLNCDAIIAWAWDANRPNDPIKLDVYDGDTLLATISAEHFRQDLLDSHKGNGNHYVFWNMPLQVKDGKPHTISVKYGGTSLMIGKPTEITCNLEKK